MTSTRRRPTEIPDLERNDFSDIQTPVCECGGILKPDVVFYGDSVPRARVDAAYAWVDAADALLVIGSSLMVFSSFRFARRAHERGIPVFAVNQGRTRADDFLTLKVEGDAGEILTRLALAENRSGDTTS